MIQPRRESEWMAEATALTTAISSRTADETSTKIFTLLTDCAPVSLSSIFESTRNVAVIWRFFNFVVCSLGERKLSFETNERLIDKFELESAHIFCSEPFRKSISDFSRTCHHNEESHRNRSHKWICFEVFSIVSKFFPFSHTNFQDFSYMQRPRRFPVQKRVSLGVPTDLKHIFRTNFSFFYNAEISSSGVYTSEPNFTTCCLSHFTNAFLEEQRESVHETKEDLDVCLRYVFMGCIWRRTRTHWEKSSHAAASEVAIFHAAALSLCWIDATSLRSRFFRCSFPCLTVSSWIIDLKKSKCDSLASVRLFVFVQFVHHKEFLGFAAAFFAEFSRRCEISEWENNL